MLVALVPVALMIATSCKDPTEIVVDVHTNVAFRPDLVTSFTVGARGDTESAFPTTEIRTPYGADGDVGSLVVIPGGAKDATVSIKVVMGIGREARDCSIANAAGCIIARRTLRYVPHTRLELPISLFTQCVGVPCDADTTCNILGQCVPATIPPEACAGEVCDVPGGSAPPAGVPADASIEGGDGAAPNDAAPRDAGDAEASFDGGTVPPDVPPVCPLIGGTRCTRPNTCCTVGSGWGCLASACAEGDTTFECTGHCPAGTYCCLATIKNVTRATCRPALDCNVLQGELVCESALDCAVQTDNCTSSDGTYPQMTFCTATQ